MKGLKKFLESRQEETGPKTERGEDRRSNRTRQNNGADRNLQSNDSPEISDKSETSEKPGLPFGHAGQTCDTCQVKHVIHVGSNM